MGIFHALNISASALTAQRLRMDVIASNLANVDTTRARFVNGEWVPYRRKMVVFEPRNDRFANIFADAIGRQNGVGNGVQATAIVADNHPFKLVYDPDHPDANEEGYVRMPNVDPLKEMVDLVSATRSYEANVTALNATKSMLVQAIQIGK